MNNLAQGAVALVGVTVMSAALAGEAQAATISETETFTSNSLGITLTFDRFDADLGTLTGVTFDIDSSISVEVGTGMFTIGVPFGEVVVIGQTELDAGGSTWTETFDALATVLTVDFFLDDQGATFDALLTYSGSGGWEGNPRYGHSGLTVTYEYTPVPLPASLPLMVAGIGGLGLLRRKKARDASA